MTAECRSRFERGGGRVLAVALLTVAVLFGQAAAGYAQFPDFVPMAYTPSGVAVDKPGNVYVSTREGAHGVIWKYTKDGAASFVADLGQAVIYGLAARPNGDVYAAMATGPDQGVYRIDRNGNAELLPGSQQIVLPNGLAFDDRGTLYVTESFSGSPGAYGQGGIWRIPKGGDAQLWLRHPLLTGIGILGSPIGANGIAYDHGALFVTNTDKGLLLRIPLELDGSPGEIEMWKKLGEVPESPLAGAKLPVMPDGLALDVHGNLYVAVISRNAIVRLGADDRVQESVAVLGSPGPVPPASFDTPASLAFGTGAGEQQNLLVTNLGMMAAIIPGPKWPGKALVKVDAGVPGRPLR
jgi:sugar lactone lactonase YvrE